MNPLISATEPRLIDFLRDSGFKPPVLHLVDVGVSGGIHSVWRHWHDALHAIGIDTLEDEIELLRKNETAAHITYEAARLIGPKTEETDREIPTNYPLHRASSYLATRLIQGDPKEQEIQFFRDLWKDTFSGLTYPIPSEANFANISDPMADPFYGFHAKRFARDRKVCVTNRAVTLDQLLAPLSVSPDILKIDTDGSDFDVLRGAEKTLRHCIAVEIEIQFHGPISATSNVFCNIDSFMRLHGFTLLKLEQAHYSRSALPRPFLYDIPAQTRGGPLQWGDAFYARDLIATKYGENFGMTPSKDQLRTLGLILDVYGLEDLVAEIVLKHSDLFAPISADQVLDFLAQRIYGSTTSYKEVVHQFAKGCAAVDCSQTDL